MKEPQYLAIIDSKHATIAQIQSSDFGYCCSTMMRQLTRPFISAQIINTHTQQPIIVMREIQ